MNEMERIYGGVSPEQRTMLTEIPHVLAVLAGYLGDATLNSVDSGFNTLEKLVENYRNSVARYGRELVQAYAGNERSTLAWELRNKLLNKKPVMQALEPVPTYIGTQFTRVAKNYLQPLNINYETISRDVRRFLRVAPQSLSGYNPFSRGLASMAKVAKLAHLGGVATTWLIPTGLALYDSAQAWGTDAFGRVTAGGAGKVLGGVAGAPAAYGTCNLILGYPTAGTSLFWCALIVGAPAGMLLSGTGGIVGEGIYDAVSWKIPSGTFVTDQCRIPGK